MVAMNHNFVSYIHWVRNFLVADLKKHLSACGMCPKIARAALPCQASILGGGKAKDLVEKVLLPGNMDSIIINTMPKSGSVYIMPFFKQVSVYPLYKSIICIFQMMW